MRDAMKRNPAILRSCFTCDELGNIMTIIRDDLTIFTGMTRPDSFIQFFDPEHLELAGKFWHALLRQSAVFSWSIPISVASFKGNAKFNGLVGSKEISIVVSNQDNEMTADEPATQNYNIEIT